MDKALEQSLSTKPFVKGLLFADLNGLLITGKSLHPLCTVSDQSETFLLALHMTVI